jgi:peroxiredoxin
VELPRLQPLYEKFNDQGLEVVAIEAFQDRDRAEKLISKHGLTFSFLENVDDDVVGNVFNVWSFPTSFLIDRDGRVMHVHDGFEAGDEVELEREILELL